MSSSLCRDAPSCRHPFCIEVLQNFRDIDDRAFQAWLVAVEHSHKHIIKQPKRTSSLSGHRWITELWEENDHRFREQMRMSKETMRGLINYLQQHCGLTQYGRLTIEESVGMFMKFVGTGSNYTDVEERFQHSGETVNRHYYHVLQAMCILADYMIQPTPGQFDDVPEQIRIDSRYYPYFDECVGALDGTHVTLRIPPVGENIKFLNRKGHFSTNVLAVCDFNMCFIYAAVGKEGARHDSSILKEMIRSTRRPFPLPPMGKYYLGDSGYGVGTGILTPYKNSRYHLPEFRQAGVIRNRKENFNYHHSSLRSVIERTFGVLKSRFRILNNMIKFKKDVQIHTVWACLGLHNFIKRYAAQDFYLFAENVMREEYVYEIPHSDDDSDSDEDDSNIVDRSAMEALREYIKAELSYRGRNRGQNDDP